MQMLRSSTPRGLLLKAGSTTPVRPMPLTTELRDGEIAVSSFDQAIIDRVMREGYEAGWREGVAAGQLAAEAQAVEAEAERDAGFRRACDALLQAAASVERAEALEIDDLERALAETAAVLAEAVIGAELRCAGGAVAEAVRRGLAIAPRTGSVVVRLHPGDAAQLPTHELDQLGGGRAVTVAPDPSVEPGGCLVELGACTVDAQLSSAIDRVRAELGLSPLDR